MTLDERISSFAGLGALLRRYPGDDEDVELRPIREAAARAGAANGWFTSSNISLALHALGEILTNEKLVGWVTPYVPTMRSEGKTIGVVFAGNIPAVGFHDFLCVLLSGHRLLAKLSSDDPYLIPAMAAMLEAFSPEWRDRITFTTDRLTNFDAIIATGSNNTSRYFDYYFGRYPHIIRSNRNAIAILHGEESRDELTALGDDLYSYFGLGCRNVSKIYVPNSYDFTTLVEPFKKYNDLRNHHKYRNNYDYMKSIYLINKVPFFDTGTLLITENSLVASPISVLYFEKYTHLADILPQIEAQKERLQCVVSTKNPGLNFIKPGMAQRPELDDYADGVDTMKFLLEGIS